MTREEVRAGLLAQTEAATLNIDQWCYYWSQVTGSDCPAPEDFAQLLYQDVGLRDALYSLDEFLNIAFDRNFGGAPAYQPETPGPVTVPVVIGPNPGALPVTTLPETAICPQVMKQCPDGSFVGYKPGTCEYQPCPGPGTPVVPGAPAPTPTRPPAGGGLASVPGALFSNPLLLLLVGFAVYKFAKKG